MARPASDGGGGYDIEIRENLFQANQKAKTEFENKFNPAYVKMKALYEELQSSQGFTGNAKKGFMESFEILLLFHEDLNKYLPDLYKSIETLQEDLSNLENDIIFKGLK